jgi:shikimate kinase
MGNSWILVGMMGAGKSSVGRRLAEMAGRPFVDTDQLIQARLGRPIPQIFQIYGEATFRDHETSVLRGLEAEGQVLATGGGIVLREQNWTEMARLGRTAYLRASIATLMGRLEQSKKRRPLLATVEWRDRLARLMEVREPLYARADLVIDVDGRTMEAVASHLLDRFQEVTP